jgi:hypothetical protein
MALDHFIYLTEYTEGKAAPSKNTFIQLELPDFPLIIICRSGTCDSTTDVTTYT